MMSKVEREQYNQGFKKTNLQERREQDTSSQQRSSKLTPHTCTENEVATRSWAGEISRSPGVD
jgi:hypothetical protein